MSIDSIRNGHFVNTYLNLISLSEDAPAEKFNSNSEYYRLSSLGPSLPKIKVKLPKKTTPGHENLEKRIKIQLKSIKVPFKFTTQLEGVPVSATVYKVKSDAINEVSLLKDAGISPENIKILVKGKVLLDSANLRELSGDQDQLTFMCTVSQPVAKEPRPSDPGDSDLNDVAFNKDITYEVSESTWSKLNKVLIDDLGQQKADYVLSKFKESLA